MSDLKAKTIVDVRVYGDGGELLIEETDQEMAGTMTLEIEHDPFSPRIGRIVVDPKEALLYHADE